MTVPKSIFRAYDIRGVAFDTLTEEGVYKIGRALGSLARERNQTEVIVGRDGRLSGPALKAQLVRGLLESGCDVIDIGEIPSPVLYFSTYELNISAGAMLTASHNPKEDNGLKAVLNFQALSAEDIQCLYDKIDANDFKTGAGKVSTRSDMIERYWKRIISDITLARPLKVVIDCGNSISGVTAPTLFRKLGCEVIELFCEVDGNFPNHQPDPSIPENLIDLQKAVLQHSADVGLAFDGDGDRLGVISSRGDIIWPDRQMILFAKDVLSRNTGAHIIYDVKCTRALSTMIEKYQGHPIMSKTGHSFVKAALNENKEALLAGEMSGHIFFKERWYGFDDGVYAGARMLEILSKDARKSELVFAEIPNSVSTPELKLPVQEEQKFKLMDTLAVLAKFPNATVITIDGLRVEYADGFGLVRASNTSAYLILRFESDTEEGLKRIQADFRDLLHGVDAQLQLPF